MSGFSFVESLTRIVGVVVVIFLASFMVTVIFNWGVADVVQIRIRGDDEKKS